MNSQKSTWENFWVPRRLPGDPPGDHQETSRRLPGDPRRLPWDLPSALAMIFRCSLHSWPFRHRESPNHQRHRNIPRGPTLARSPYPPRIREYSQYGGKYVCNLLQDSQSGPVQASVTSTYINLQKRYSKPSSSSSSCMQRQQATKTTIK